ncbi:MAG: T9SS type A sorting domain-containing protein [Ignavibacteria bacterium]|nr:T9SS type A sorting domain-containing protein [Ignavibacteria bacterium]
MKFITFTSIAIIILFAAKLSYPQSVSLNPNSLHVKTVSDLGANCTDGQIHDDGVPENGYGWIASAGDPSAFCQKFIPPFYPYKFSKFCINLTRTSAGTSNFTFKIVQWKCVNGMPANIMDSTTVTATGIPVYPSFAFYDFVLPTTWANVTIAGDSVFLGIRYNPVTMSAVYVGADETITTPIWPGWATTAAGPWQNPAVLWPTYRAIMFRAEGGSAVQYVHNYGVIDFLNLPDEFVKYTPYIVKAKVQNFGTSEETNVPVSFFVNGTQVGSAVTLSLPAGGVDSVGFPWTPTSTGSKTLMVVSQLGTDQLKANDTIRTVKTVVLENIYLIFCDHFQTLGNWTLTSTGTVPWSLQTAAYNNMIMPTTSVLPWMSCNVDAAGLENTSNAVATLTTDINCTNRDWISLEFDQDWYVMSSSDQAIVDYSTNGGSSWINLATWTTSHRSEHVTLDMPLAENRANVRLRFTAIQPSFDWWWAIDNICVKGYPPSGINNPGTSTQVNYSLSQNYPNPFNPITQIKYSIKTNGPVTLKVYDILGKEVTTLVNEVKSAGAYIIDFNGANLASGTYLYKLESNGFTDIKKMILIK